MSKLGYVLRETISIFTRFKWIFILSLISSTLSFLLLGSFLIGWLTISAGIKEWKEKVEIAVFLKDGIGQGRVKALFNEISNMEEVRDVSYISKEEALSKFKIEMAQARMLVRAIGGIPLPDTFIV
jgi:cell division transport system permease protein